MSDEKKVDEKPVDEKHDAPLNEDHYLIIKVDPNVKTKSKTVEVKVSEKEFDPAEVNIGVGDNVNWIFESKDENTTAEDRFASVRFLDNTLNTEPQKNTFTAGKNFDKSGEYHYVSDTTGCSGVVVVK